MEQQLKTVYDQLCNSYHKVDDFRVKHQHQHTQNVIITRMRRKGNYENSEILNNAASDKNTTPLPILWLWAKERKCPNN